METQSGTKELVEQTKETAAATEAAREAAEAARSATAASRVMPPGPKAAIRIIEAQDIGAILSKLDAPDRARAYLNCSIDQMEQLARDYPSHLPTLLALGIELRHRRTSRAACLRPDVTAKLIETVQQLFPWPSTMAPGGDGSLTDDYFMWPEGLLSHMGYHVGKSRGIAEDERRRILRDVYTKDLPNEAPRVHLSSCVWTCVSRTLGD